MKNKKVFAVGLVLSLVLLLGIGFFFNSKNSKKEVDLSVAAPVMATYVEEKYGYESFSNASHDNQEKIIELNVIEYGLTLQLMENSKEEVKEFKEQLCDMSLDVKKVANDFLNRKDINISIKVLNDLNPDRYLIQIVNGEVKYSFK